MDRFSPVANCEMPEVFGLKKVAVSARAVTCETSTARMATVRTLVPENRSPLPIYFIEHRFVSFNLRAYNSHAFSTRVVPSPLDLLFASFGFVIGMSRKKIPAATSAVSHETD
jgi:hypothetical protein